MEHKEAKLSGKSTSKQLESGSEFGQAGLLTGTAEGGPESLGLLQLQAAADASPQVQEFRALQQMVTESPMQQEAQQRKETLEQNGHVPRSHEGGLPESLLLGIEQLSGMDMGDVRVHRNSSKAREAGALAYAQGNEIHLGPGQEHHLPHEAWHVVQQRQGRVQPTTEAPNGAPVNDDEALEKEATEMGEKALRIATNPKAEGITAPASLAGGQAQLMQRYETTTEREKSKSNDQDEEVEEANGEIIVSKYWARTSVKASNTNTKVDPKDYTVLSVDLSPERRKTKQDKKQGDHLVAWSVMYRYWQTLLTGNLETVIKNLKDLLIADEIADQIDNTKERSEAIWRTNLIAAGDLDINQCLTLFEEAVSLFITTNQASSFAVVGQASGGNDEAGARKKLETYENQAIGKLLDQKDYPNAISEASKLLDIGKVSVEITKGKAIITWRNMLQGLYPTLFGLIKTDLEKEVYGSRTVSDWVSAYDKHINDKGINDDQASLVENSDKILNKKNDTIDKWKKLDQVGTRSNIGPEKEGSDKALTANEVTVAGLEIPEKLRSKTQFGNTQGSHTIAFTFLRQSLIKRLEGKTAFDALNSLLKLATSDLDYAKDEDSLEGKVNKTRLTWLKTMLDNLLKEKKPLEFWITDINNAVIEYIEINQLMTSSSYKLAGTATNHGEQSANVVFGDASKLDDKDYDDKNHINELVTYGQKYLDLGFVFAPLIRDLSRRTELVRATGEESRSDLLKKRRTKKEDKDTKKETDDDVQDLVVKKVKLEERVEKQSNGVQLIDYEDDFMKLIDEDTFDKKKVENYVKENEGNHDKVFGMMNLSDDIFSFYSNIPLEKIGKMEHRDFIDKNYNFHKEDKHKERKPEIKTRSEKIKTTFQSALKKTSSYKERAKRELLPIDDRIDNPTLYASEIIRDAQPMLGKVLADFKELMGSFDSRFAKKLTVDGIGNELIAQALLASFQEKDTMIYQPMKNLWLGEANVLQELVKAFKDQLTIEAKQLKVDYFK